MWKIVFSLIAALMLGGVGTKMFWPDNVDLSLYRGVMDVSGSNPVKYSPMSENGSDGWSGLQTQTIIVRRAHVPIIRITSIVASENTSVTGTDMGVNGWWDSLMVCGYPHGQDPCGTYWQSPGTIPHWSSSTATQPSAEQLRGLSDMLDTAAQIEHMHHAD